VWIVSVALSIVAVACARGIPELTRSATPTISWIINARSAGGSEYVVCRSGTRAPCEVPASTSSAKQLATVHLYLHPSGRDTVYSGTMQVNFMNGHAPDIHEGTIQSTVRPGDAPLDVSVSGPVTPIPGVYSTKISLLATAAPEGVSHPIREVIRVAVK
jgi:hypothetical protein